MSKYSFKYDFSEGCHPNILKALADSNFEQHIGYGNDQFAEQAKALIKAKIKHDKAKIFFVSGGTQANLIVISSILKPYEAVISAKTGHIAKHETGAIEATGHKVMEIEGTHGKIGVAAIAQALADFMPPHTVKPKMVYITHSTELGTIYTKKELEEISVFCRQNQLYLFLDGARLGSALMAENADISLEDLAQLTDVFYIGGTKNGALLGEAIIINNEALQSDFELNIKQKGGLLAKGRLLSIQFLELFKDDLIFKLAQHANLMAAKLSLAIKAKGYSFYTPSNTNQLFPILPNDLVEKLSQKYDFYVWQKYGSNHAIIRLVCSWATEESKVDAFIAELS